MPWMENNAVSERMKFVSRYLEGERMTDLCSEFSISRKTGYKFIRRYEELGALGFENKDRAPRSHPNQTPTPLEAAIVDLRLQHPTWGARKIKAYLERKTSNIPAKSTIHCILARHELVKAKRRRKTIARAKGTNLSSPDLPNDLWCTDFKGQFRLKSREYCYPLTVTDQFSRYLLACEAHESVREQECIEVFHGLFTEFGIPKSIRSDNGVPFASSSLFGMSRLSVFWLRQGITIERIVPGHPEQNGAHERMHRTLKAEATKPPQSNMLKQQEIFDAFQYLYNCKRPHESLDMKSPTDVYKKSQKTYEPQIESLTYPGHDLTARITKCGKLFLDNQKLKVKLTIGIPFGGQNVGLTEIEQGIWKVTFMDFEMGFFDLETQKIQIPTNPFLKNRIL